MKAWLKQNRGFLLFLIGFAFFRSAMADWNPIPSGSMRPTLLEGDVVLVNRLAYDFKVPLTDISLVELGDPKRGDVVTFTSPSDGMRLIKRLVAVPGDVVEMRDERLIINGVAAEYAGFRAVEERGESGARQLALRGTERSAGSERAVQYLPGALAMRSFGAVVVPKDSYFFLGDNRDNSADSRYIGVVPRQRLIGRAHHVLVSADITDGWVPRFERFGQRIR
ncbi:MAG TPA: signal peptidase I [Caldimonas sp.]|jgi:signal peptidase I